MRRNKHLSLRLLPFFYVGIIAGIGLHSGNAEGKVSPQRLDSTRKLVRHVRSFAKLIPDNFRRALSGGAQNLLNLADKFDRIEPLLLTEQRGRGVLPPFEALAPTNVSRPAADTDNLAITRFAGFTQNETHAAWCGNNAVVGYNDTGSVIEALLGASPSGSFSFNGFSRSTNANASSPSYTDMGALVSDPLPAGVVFRDLFGDPVLGCANSNKFYYASIAVDSIDSDNDGFTDTFTSGISVSKSTNGGASFGGAVMAAAKDFDDHFLDKPWMAVDPTNKKRLYVTYTDFDTSFASAACGSDFRTAIELVRSTDGGATWSAPVVVREVCGDAFLQGSQVAVGPGGEVYVAYEFIDADFTTREIDIQKSTDNGTTFSGAVKVDDVVPVGGLLGEFGGLLQGMFRPAFEMPSIAVNLSGSNTGHVYVVWHDARDGVVLDAIGGQYGYADVFFSRSVDGGATWSPAVRVNNNPEPLASGLSTDQYQPSVAADRTSGALAACFYDRRNDPRNFRIQRFCGRSTNNGASWSNFNTSGATGWAPVPGQDLLLSPVYMGDYDATVSDFTGANAGFITTWGENSQGNPDARENKF